MGLTINRLFAAGKHALHWQFKINPHTTQKNNPHFRLHWGPMDPATILVVKRSFK